MKKPPTNKATRNEAGTREGELDRERRSTRETKGGGVKGAGPQKWLGIFFPRLHVGMNWALSNVRGPPAFNVACTPERRQMKKR